MKVSVFTADYVSSDDRGKLNAIGLAWNNVGTPLPPHGVAVVIEVAWNEANERKAFVLELLDEDGSPVSFGNGDDPAPALHLEGEFEVGRPPGVAKGTPLLQTLAVNFPGGMPLPAGKRFEYRVTIDDVEGRAPFAVIQSV